MIKAMHSKTLTDDEFERREVEILKAIDDWL